MKDEKKVYNNHDTKINKEDDWTEMDDSKPISIMADLARAFGSENDLITRFMASQEIDPNDIMLYDEKYDDDNNVKKKR